MKEYKVYQFYLKNEKEPYAFTIDKKIGEDFLYQRNRELFYIKKVKMNEYEYMAFSNNNKKLMLTRIPINSSPTDYQMIVATYKEEDQLMYESDQLDEKMASIYRRLVLQSHLKKKYTDAIEYVSKTSYLNEDKDNISTINLLALFLKTFENTFKKIEEYEDE